MLNREAILAMIPHQGTMCLLDGVRDWCATRIVAVARSHLDAANPLRRGGRLAAICGCEYAFQAAALHGGLTAGGAPQPAGVLASLDLRAINVERLDDSALGTLSILAELELSDARGLIYRFRLEAETGAVLLEGRGVVALPREPA